MRKNTVIISTLIFLLLNILSPFTIIGLAYNIASPKNLESNQQEPFSIIYHSATSDSNHNLYLVYHKQTQSFNVIEFMTANSYYVWNTTAQQILAERIGLDSIGKPTITVAANQLYIVVAFVNSSLSGLLLLTKNTTDYLWNDPILIFNTTTGSLKNPILTRNPAQDVLWLSWLNGTEGSNNVYYCTYNRTSTIWTKAFYASNNNTENCLDHHFIADNNGIAHLVFSEGPENYEKIYYRKIYQNGTLENVEEVTNGANSCRYPYITKDTSNILNVFWNNLTVVDPGFEYGTKNIYTRSKATIGPWSEMIEVAPYIPPERPSTGESDAMKFAAVFDKQNVLWLAYEIREQYAYHMGVDIRSRLGSNWLASEKLALVNNAARDPMLIPDLAGNLHCFWLDIRFGTYEIYYRTKFSSGVWTEEKPLTAVIADSSGLWKFILGFLVAIVVIASPLLIARYIQRRRQTKFLKEKIKDLQR
ncbi:MAG: hypothetical protein FK734_03980 [Asgard group archaeon]|nr:hypothetical protein [Asgard group archaeon]